MKKHKITYIISNVDKAIAFEWISDRLDSDKFNLSFILLSSFQPSLYLWLKERKITCHYISFFGKKSYPRVFVKTLMLLIKERPHAIHTHMFDANLIGLTIARILNIKKRIFTRHHATYHHAFFPSVVKYDLWSNRMASHIVAISKNVENILIQKEHVSPSKIRLIHHGFEIEKFQNISEERIQLMANKYELEANAYPVIGVVSRFIKLKGIQYIIPAFKDLLKTYPKAKLVLANASGPDTALIKKLLNEIPNHNKIEIKFEDDLFTLYQLFDIYIHVPIDHEIEAFGQTYVEALAAGIPSIFTLSGVAKEFVVDKHNALVVDYQNSNQIYDSMFAIIQNKYTNAELIRNGKASIVKKFNLNSYILKLEALYSS